nr:MAG TPA: hypothetical protein [Caudoviricetes sp.]
MKPSYEHSHRVIFAFTPKHLYPRGWAWLTYLVKSRVECDLPCVCPSSWTQYRRVEEYQIKYREKQ